MTFRGGCILTSHERMQAVPVVDFLGIHTGFWHQQRGAQQKAHPQSSSYFRLVNIGLHLIPYNGVLERELQQATHKDELLA